MIEKLPEISNDKVNATKKLDLTKNNKSNKDKPKKQRKNKKAKDALSEWQAALGPYPVVSPGTREASFVHAISSAGVAHAVTRSCSSGELENCGCDRSLRGMSPEGFQVKTCFITPKLLKLMQLRNLFICLFIFSGLDVRTMLTLE